MNYTTQATQKLTQEILTRCGVLHHGHFRLTSGLHSNVYMQCAKLFERPDDSETLCRKLAESFTGEGLEKIDVVASPALGGVLMGYEVARALGARNIFAERDSSGTMTFRRGFHVEPGTRALVVEDVVTTGGSVKEVIQLLRESGAVIVGVGSVVDRSGGKADFGVPFHPLMVLEAQTWNPEDCPLCKDGQPIEKPGSRPTKA